MTRPIWPSSPSCGSARALLARIGPCIGLWSLVLIAPTCVAAKPQVTQYAAGSEKTDGFSTSAEWKVTLGAAYVDTFPFAHEAVLPIAARVLSEDRWRVQSTDSLTGRIVTHWQPVRHIFVRLFLGEVRERCVVDVTPLSGRSTLVTFRAGLATRKSIGGSPLLPRVRKEYEEGVYRWQKRVRRALVAQERSR